MIRFIKDHPADHGVEPICRVLPIAPATFYDHLAKRADPSRPSDRARRDKEGMQIVPLRKREVVAEIQDVRGGSVRGPLFEKIGEQDDGNHPSATVFRRVGPDRLPPALKPASFRTRLTVGAPNAARRSLASISANWQSEWWTA